MNAKSKDEVVTRGNYININIMLPEQPKPPYRPWEGAT
jgi:hypothetical protein